jgi:hypothetical protein
MSNPIDGSERAHLDVFIAIADDGISPRDQRDPDELPVLQPRQEPVCCADPL